MGALGFVCALFPCFCVTIETFIILLAVCFCVNVGCCHMCCVKIGRILFGNIHGPVPMLLGGQSRDVLQLLQYYNN